MTAPCQVSAQVDTTDHIYAAVDAMFALASADAPTPIKPAPVTWAKAPKVR